MKVIDRACLPTRMPIMFTAIVYLLLDKFQPPGWVYGAVWLFMVLVWIGVLDKIFKEQKINIFKNWG